MNARELVGFLLGAFRAAPVREGGTEGSYRAHELRAALEIVLEAVELEALLAAGLPGPPSGVAARWRELLQVVKAYPPPAPLPTMDDAIKKGRGIQSRILALLECDHSHFVGPVGCCSLCGSVRSGDGWTRPIYVRHLAEWVGEPS